MIDFIESRAGCIILVVLLLCAAEAAAQKEVLSEMPISLSGTVSSGYAGGSGGGLGAQGGSTNSFTVGTADDLIGYYYNPRFLQFSVSPRFTWDRNGTAAQSAAMQDRNDGVVATADFLQGSKTPIHLTYSLGQTNTTSVTGGPTPFTVAAGGLAQALSVSSSIRLAHLPTLNMSFSHTDSQTDVSGVEAPTEHTSANMFNFLTTYLLAGFHLSGTYLRTSNESTTQDLLNLGVPYAPSVSSSQSENFSVSHTLPWRGSASLSFGKSSDSYTVSGTPQNNSYDTATASFAVMPTQRLTWNADGNYTSNATDQLINEVINGQPTSSTVLGTGRSLILDSGMTYRIGHGFSASGAGSHGSSTVLGEQLTQNLGYGTLTYNHSLFHGFLSMSYSPGWNMVDVTEAGVTESTSGLYNTASVSYQHRVGRWMAHGNFSYLNNSAAEASSAPEVANAYSANGTVRTKIRYTWEVLFNGSVSKSTVVGYNGTLTELFSGQISNRTWSFNAQYQRNSGYLLFSGSGAPVASATGTSGSQTPSSATQAAWFPVNPDAWSPPVLRTLYNTSDGYSFSGSYNRRQLSFTADYTYGNGVYDTATVPTTTSNTYLDMRLYYKLRKLDFQAGYRRLTQAASSNNALNQVSSGYWLTLIRRFHAF